MTSSEMTFIREGCKGEHIAVEEVGHLQTAVRGTTWQLEKSFMTATTENSIAYLLERTDVYLHKKRERVLPSHNGEMHDH